MTRTMRPQQFHGKAARAARARGFTLIEVITVVMIIGILAAIAIPSYTQYIQRGNRSDAKAMLLQAAQWQARIRTETNAYAAALPAGLSQVPPAPQAAKYTVAVTASTATTYTLTATRAGTMAADGCGDFTLDQTGLRGQVNNALPREQCWDR